MALRYQGRTLNLQANSMAQKVWIITGTSQEVAKSSPCVGVVGAPMSVHWRSNPSLRARAWRKNSRVIRCSRLRRLVAWVPVIALVFGPISKSCFGQQALGDGRPLFWPSVYWCECGVPKKYVPREMSLELASDFRAINTACFQHCLQGKMG